MNKFKVGDRVELLGIEYVVKSRFLENVRGTNGLVFERLGVNRLEYCSEAYGYPADSGGWPEFREGDMKAVERVVTKIKGIKSKSIMESIKEKFTLAFKKEPEKSFRKADITNGDDFLTDDGQKVFLGWLLAKSGADFKKEVVDELLKKEDK